MPDISVVSHGTLFGLTPETEEGEQWLSDHLPEDVQCIGTTRFCEPRYAGPIVAGATMDGLVVE